MKIYWKIWVLGALLTTGLGNDSFAQDNNLLAKAAYENAEEALAAGKIGEAHKELVKVDELLGKLTPKAQYLRVQIWAVAVTQNPDNVHTAIEQCKKYLSLSKAYELPEDKALEIVKLQGRLEKQKSELEQQKKALAARQQQAEDLNRLAGDYTLAAVKAIDSFAAHTLKYVYGETIQSLQKKSPELSNLLKNKYQVERIVNGKAVARYRKVYEGTGQFFQIGHYKDNGVILSLQKNMLTSKNEGDVQTAFNDLKAKLKTYLGNLLVADEGLKENKIVEIAEFDGAFIYKIKYKDTYRSIVINKLQVLNQYTLYMIVWNVNDDSILL